MALARGEQPVVTLNNNSKTCETLANSLPAKCDVLLAKPHLLLRKFLKLMNMTMAGRKMVVVSIIVLLEVCVINIHGVFRLP